MPSVTFGPVCSNTTADDMKKTILLLGLCAGFAMAASTSSRTPVLVELFTSEGCSSCPPADRLLEMLDQKQPFSNVDLIVLSEHVDYWNEGGWADPYSSKLFSDRQSYYAEQFGSDSIYTPERVVDGAFYGVGSNAATLKADVEKAAQDKKVLLTLSNVSRSGNQIKFHADTADLGVDEKEATLYIALAQDQVRSEVRRGENAGRTLTHVAVVASLKPVGSVKTGNPFSKDLTIDVPARAGSSSRSLRLVAFLQIKKTQKIIGVTESKL